MVEHRGIRRESGGGDVAATLDVDAIADAACSAASCPRTRVMVVEDDDVTGRVLVRLLHGAGFEATHVQDHRSALRKACTWLPDVLICDLDLHAERDGCDVLRTMRQAYPGLRGISVSGLTDEVASPTSKSAGFNAHLPKPFGFDELLSTIEASILTRARTPRRPLN